MNKCSTLNISEETKEGRKKMRLHFIRVKRPNKTKNLYTICSQKKKINNCGNVSKLMTFTSVMTHI